jgi:hypothetical protein
MSYIRCLSNPENLYITNHGKKVCISTGGENPQIYADTKHFEAAFFAYKLASPWHSDFKFGNVRLYEDETDFLWRLQVGDSAPIKLYEVTVSYIANNNTFGDGEYLARKWLDKMTKADEKAAAKVMAMVTSAKKKAKK